MLRPLTIYSVLLPMYYITKIVGLTPFKLNPTCYKRSKINLCLCICLMIFFNTYTSVGLLKRPSIDWQLIMVLTDIASAYLTQANMAISIFFGCIYSNTILEVLASIDNFDKDLQKIYPKLNLAREYRKSKIRVFIGTLTTTLFLFTVIVLSYLPQLDSLLFFGEFLAYIVPEIMSTLVLFQFCTILLCARQRFFWLNKIIKSLGRKFGKEYVFSTAMTSKVVLQDYVITTLDKMRCKHYQLYEACKKINVAYSIQLLLIVAQVFITIIVLIYYSGQHIFFDAEIPIAYVMYCFIHIILAILQIIVLTNVCSSTSREAKNTGILFYGIISKQSGKKYKEELQIGIVTFSLQLLQENLHFTACNFLTLDEGLLLSIAGAVTTYLVIVIQFDIKNDEKTYLVFYL